MTIKDNPIDTNRIDEIIIPPLIWVKDSFGEHYKWKNCIDNNMECDIYKCQEALMCDALTLAYEGDRSQPLVKEIHHEKS